MEAASEQFNHKPKKLISEAFYAIGLKLKWHLTGLF
jgi:hypothetical protein